MRIPLLLITTSALALSACTPNVQTRGHIKDANWQEAIQPGTSGRDDVLVALGSPSTHSSFGKETWYYITTKRESFAFFKPEITDQDVLAVMFDSSGLVENVQQVGKEGLKEIEYTSRETPTEGHSLTFVEQLIGNMGRFNRPEGAGNRSVGSNRPGGR